MGISSVRAFETAASVGSEFVPWRDSHPPQLTTQESARYWTTSHMDHASKLLQESNVTVGRRTHCLAEPQLRLLSPPKQRARVVW
jgi:hypothetical protein